MTSRYLRRATRRFMAGAIFFLLFLAFGGHAYGFAISDDSQSFAYFAAFLALVFLTGSVLEFREAIRCERIHGAYFSRTHTEN